MLSLTIVCLSAASIARNAIWADKVTFWNDVAKKSPKKPRVHTLYGNALLEQGKTDAGIEEIRAAIKLKPNRTNARINLGKALLMQKRYDDAIAELQAAVRLNAKDPLPYIYLGLAHEGKEQLLSAEEIYLDVVMLSPSYPDAHLRLGELYVKENRIPDAIKEFETVLKFYPDEEIRKRMDDLKRMVVKP
jgi:tetratricopeptide (TPR) repeat protein